MFSDLLVVLAFVSPLSYIPKTENKTLKISVFIDIDAIIPTFDPNIAEEYHYTLELRSVEWKLSSKNQDAHISKIPPIIDITYINTDYFSGPSNYDNVQIQSYETSTDTSTDKETTVTTRNNAS